MPDRSFPAPWSSEEHSGYYVIRDRNGQGLAYIYYKNEPERRQVAKSLSKEENEPGRRQVAKLLSKDEARRIAANFARLPELLNQ